MNLLTDEDLADIEFKDELNKEKMKLKISQKQEEFLLNKIEEEKKTK